jgi:hypothetical protein
MRRCAAWLPLVARCWCFMGTTLDRWTYRSSSPPRGDRRQVGVCVCMCVYAIVCTQVCMRVCVRDCVHTSVYACVYACVFASVCSQACVLKRVSKCVCMCVHMYVCTCECTQLRAVVLVAVVVYRRRTCVGSHEAAFVCVCTLHPLPWSCLGRSLLFLSIVLCVSAQYRLFMMHVLRTPPFLQEPPCPRPSAPW